MLLTHIADAALQESPDKTAILCGNQRLTYSMFVAAADHLAADLVRRGCRHGDRVALGLLVLSALALIVLLAAKIGC